MKVAVVYFKELKKEDLVWALLQANFETAIIDTEISIHSVFREDILIFAKRICEEKIDVIITYDFCPALSDACQMCNILYVSWIYDCPQKALYEKAVSNECNYIFSFDKRQVENIKRSGGKNVFYQSLGTNVFRNSGIVINKEDEEKYACEVSFIGNLFTDNFFDVAERTVDDTTKNEYKAIINEAYGKWDGCDRIHNKLSKKAINSLVQICPKEFGDEFKMDLDEFFSTRLIAYRLANRERIEMLTRLSKYNIQFYTAEKSGNIEGITPRPALDYINELPKAYCLSKININITLHSITSGVPLRVFDIIGAGGFVLSNYQPAIEELFIIGKEIDVYRDIEELEYKVKYYLMHDDKRKMITWNGYNAVKTRYDNQKIIERMIDIAMINKKILN